MSVFSHLHIVQTQLIWYYYIQSIKQTLWAVVSDLCDHANQHAKQQIGNIATMTIDRYIQGEDHNVNLQNGL